MSLCYGICLQAQVTCFVQTQLDRRNVYPQQPFKVIFTVLTATWYTAPLDFDNIQIPNAFIIPFDRTRSGMFPANGKQYPGLQFYFIIFPYAPGNYTIPSIKIIATTPAVGDNKPQKVTLTTTPQPFIVKPEPAAFKAEQWFVAKDVTIKQYWNKSLKDLKIGDIVERTISIDARGTLPQFIPAIEKDSLDWADTYPHEPTLTDTRDQYDANGRLTQTFTYLLEKEGTYTFPSERIKWWNPYSNKVYSRGTDSMQIRVKPNPNLGMLTTLKDSLNATRVSLKPTQPLKKGPLLIFGLPWYWLVLYALAGSILFYSLIRVLIRWYTSLHSAYAAYLQSEPYWFRKLMRSPPALPILLAHLYTWWDRWAIPGKSSSITLEAQGEKDTSIPEDLERFFKRRYDANRSLVTGSLHEGPVIESSDPGKASSLDPDPKTTARFKKNIRQYRKKIGMIAKNGGAADTISPTQSEWQID